MMGEKNEKKKCSNENGHKEKVNILTINCIKSTMKICIRSSVNNSTQPAIADNINTWHEAWSIKPNWIDNKEEITASRFDLLFLFEEGELAWICTSVQCTSFNNSTYSLFFLFSLFLSFCFVFSFGITSEIQYHKPSSVNPVS